MVAITQFVAVGSLAVSAAYAGPLSSGCQKLQGDVSLLSKEVPQVAHFCQAYLNSDEDTSVVKGFGPARLHRACECITDDSASIKLVKSSKAASGSIAGAAAASVCKNVQLAKILAGIKDVTYFCQHFNPGMWSHSSPIFGSSTAAIQQACQCVLGAATASVSKTTVAPTASPSPAAPASPLPFKFCPTSTSQLNAWKGFCKTPLWKLWACSCSTVAQVCYPGQKLTWCPAKPSSSTPSSSATTTTTTSVAPTTTTTTTTTSVVVPTTTTTTTSTVEPVTSTSTTDSSTAASSTTDAPVDQTTTTEAPSSTPTTTTDAPVSTSTTSTTDDGSASTTDSTDPAAST